MEKLLSDHSQESSVSHTALSRFISVPRVSPRCPARAGTAWSRPAALKPAGWTWGCRTRTCFPGRRDTLRVPTEHGGLMGAQSTPQGTELPCLPSVRLQALPCSATSHHSLPLGWKLLWEQELTLKSRRFCEIWETALSLLQAGAKLWLLF